MPVNFGGPGITPSLGALNSTTVVLEAGQCWSVPSGRWFVKPGKYTVFQEFDPITQIWRAIGAGSTAAVSEVVFSDGNNYRLANQTGCPIGAIVKTAGSGYTTAPTVVASAGGSVWRAIVGGAINTSVTVTNGGTNYTYPPAVIFSAPPPGGVAATGYCTLSGTAVSTVTVVDQGAGYASPPIVTFVNDPREGTNGITTGYNAAAVCTLTGAGTVTALVCVDHGTPITTQSVPTFTFSSGSAAADAIMCWTITAYTVSSTTTGSGVTAPVIISAYTAAIPNASAILNPAIQNGLLKGRNAFIIGSVAGGSLTATSQSVVDGGVYAVETGAFPVPYIASAAVVGTAGSLPTFTTPTMGSVSDTSVVFPT